MVQNTVWQGNASVLSRFQNMDASTATEADRKAARDLAETIATNLVSRDGQHVVKGNLRLHVDDQGQATISRQRFWHNSKNDAANALIRKLVTIGYSDRADDIGRSIDNYLSTSGNKFGSQSYFKLVSRHATEQAKSEGTEIHGPLADARTREAGLFSRAPRISTDYIDYIEVDVSHFDEENQLIVSGDHQNDGEIEGSEKSFQQSQVGQADDGATHESIGDQELDGLVADRQENWSQASSIRSSSMSDQDPVVKAPEPYRPPKTKSQRDMEFQNVLLRAGIRDKEFLGRGGMGSAFSARLNGQPVVVKALGKPEPFTLNRLVDNDIGQSIYLSAGSKRLPGFGQDLSIAAPTHYLMRPSGNEPLQLVDANQAKQLLKAQRAQGVMTAICEGEVMPMAQGVDMHDHISQGGLSDADQMKVFSSLLKFGKEMTQRGIIHRDLKPDNMHIRPDTGQLSIFDWDFAFKLSSKPGTQLPRLTAGSPSYISPKVFAGSAYAHEADMHSIGMMMLHTRYPKVFDAISKSLFAGMFARNSPALSGPLNWLDQKAPSLMPKEFGQTVRADNFVGQLKARFLKLHQATEQDLSNLRAQGQALRNRLNQANAFGSPSLMQAQADQIQRDLDSNELRIKEKEAMLAETSRFLQEAGLTNAQGADPASSPTQVVLACLQQANEVAAINWYDRANAARMYQQQIEHPALRAVPAMQPNLV
jgi:serine/threonine protein kinase